MDSYDFPTKQLYRQRRHQAVDNLCAKPVALRRVAYLDTSEALDTISYLDRGYRPENLWAINRNPAEVAALTLRLKKLGLPTVNTVGVDFEIALVNRIPAMDVIDFDGMGITSMKLNIMLCSLAAFLPTKVWCVTTLAGRESAFGGSLISLCFSKLNGVERTSFNTLVKESHLMRAIVLAMSFVSEERGKLDVEDMYWDVYRSTSSQTMLWGAFKLAKDRKPIRSKRYLRFLSSQRRITSSATGKLRERLNILETREEEICE